MPHWCGKVSTKSPNAPLNWLVWRSRDERPSRSLASQPPWIVCGSAAVVLRNSVSPDGVAQPHLGGTAALTFCGSAAFVICDAALMRLSRCGFLRHRRRELCKFQSKSMWLH